MGSDWQERRDIPSVLPHISLQGHRLVRGTDTLKEVAEPLRPRDRRSPGCCYQPLRINLLGEFGKNGRHVVQPSGVVPIADKIDRSRLNGRDQECAARSIETLDRYVGDAPTSEEAHPHSTARYRPTVLGQGDLEFLRTVMGRAVVLGGGQECSIIGEPQMLQKRRNELIGREAAETPVLGRYDNVEAAGRACHVPFLCQPTQRESRSGGRHTEGGLKLRCGEMMPASGSKPVNDVACSGYRQFRFHILKVLFFNRL